ncbi:MAG: curlin repeat-containing protein [Cyclonatronaceae bacterium]
MKNVLTLLIAILFTAGMTFAQDNDATIDQVGDDHEAMIDQIGFSNTAYVDQTDGGSNGDATADILQEGDNNYVNLLQRAFHGFPDESHATITQIGDGNSVEGTSATSAFYQNQPGGILEVYMEGDDNTLYSMRDEAQKNNNEFFLDILGSENTVGMQQERGIGDVDIEGDLNTVTLSQLGNNTVFNTATIDILGNENGVSVTQTMDSNSATVNVDGSFNSATITQN